jgi:hypothetical protein
VTADDFRRVVLAMPGATESAHMGHPDFRAANRIFVTLGAPDGRYAMVKLDPVQQEMLIAAEPEIFAPVKGGWGRRGATLVILERADAETARGAIEMAWRNVTQRQKPRKAG